MKQSWKFFLLQFVITFLAAVVISYGISLGIQTPEPPDDIRSTRTALTAGGFLTPLLLATVGGWKRWHLKKILIIAFTVSALFAGNPAIAIITTLLAALVYHLAVKAKELLFYYTGPSSTGRHEA